MDKYIEALEESLQEERGGGEPMSVECVQALALCRIAKALESIDVREELKIMHPEGSR